MRHTAVHTRDINMSDEDARQEFFLDKSKLRGMRDISVLIWFATVCVFVFDGSVAMKFCAAISSIGSLLLIKNFYITFYTSGPALVLTEEGFFQPSFARDVIPWTAVTGVERSPISSVLGGNVDGAMHFRIDLDRTFSKTLASPSASSHSKSAPAEMQNFTYLPINAFTKEGSVIADAFEQKLAESKSRMHAV